MMVVVLVSVITFKLVHDVLRIVYVAIFYRQRRVTDKVNCVYHLPRLVSNEISNQNELSHSLAIKNHNFTV